MHLTELVLVLQPTVQGKEPTAGAKLWDFKGLCSAAGENFGILEVFICFFYGILCAAGEIFEDLRPKIVDFR